MRLKRLNGYLYYKKLLLIFINLYYLLPRKNPKKYIMTKLRQIKNRTNNYYFESDKNLLIKLEKNNLLDFFSKGSGENITNVRQIFLGQKIHFGNQMTLLYKVIFYCQILKCKRIILDKNIYWYIRHQIKDKKQKIKIEVGNENEIKEFTSLIDKTDNFFYYSKYLKPNFRVDLLQREILKNIPKVSINNNDLYIYIRSGGIFINPNKIYVQPPLCYYINVIKNFEFRKIYLIAQNEMNPVINKLLGIYSKIIYKKNSLKLDIALLVNAYNIAGGGISTFFYHILLLNNKKKVLFLFKIQQQPFKLFTKLNIKSFYKETNCINLLMFASKDYIIKMFPWENSRLQRDFMLSYNCSNYFIVNDYYYLYI